MTSDVGASDLAVAPHPVKQGRWRTERFILAGGEVLGALEIAYWSMGALDEDGSNAVLLCHGASGHRDWALPFCGSGRCFDPDRWFLISIDLPGGGDSSRARDGTFPVDHDVANRLEPDALDERGKGIRQVRDGTFPVDHDVADLANALAAFIEGIGLKSVRAFCGPSMASMVGLDLALRHAHLVGALALWQGGYRCDGYAGTIANILPAVLALDGSAAGMRAAAHAFLPAIVERAFLAPLGQTAREALIDRLADEWCTKWEPRELAARYQAMARCDLAAQQGGQAQLAARIGCDLLVLATSGDPIFPPRDWTAIAAGAARTRIELFNSAWGHMASAAPKGSGEWSFFERSTAAFFDGLSR